MLFQERIWKGYKLKQLLTFKKSYETFQLKVINASGVITGQLLSRDLHVSTDNLRHALLSSLCSVHHV